ncbi:glycosyltransferase family 4 protein [Balneola sp. MJW-20]|uniref:glycosyltransferase family 4 protein n=1 Tax=Gracilimonas aurantiaca TaxID=3234185 RepID=UPI0034659A90
MNCAILVPNYFLSGGVKTVANFIKDNLIKRGIKVDVISLKNGVRESLSRSITRPSSWFKGVQTNLVMDGDTRVYEYGTNWSEFEFQRYKPTKELTKKLNEYDIVQVVAGTPAWANLCRDSNPPIILQVATLTNIEREALLKTTGGLKGLWYKWMTKIVTGLDKIGMETADAIMVENNWMQKKLLSLGYESKTHLAPPGIDISIFKSKKSDPGSENLIDSDYILSVGRLADPRKDVRTLFEAYAKLKKITSDTPKLVLAGKTLPGEGLMKFAEELGITQDLYMFQEVSFRDLISLYQHASIFVLSSREEGLGMVIMESMACGIPVVATDCGGPNTLIDDSTDGFLIKVGDSDGMANKIKALLDPPLNNEFSEKAIKKIKTDFNSDICIQRYISVYHWLLKPKI